MSAADADLLRDRAATGLAVAHWAETAPDRPALVHGSTTRTFAELDGRANQVVRALRRAGVQPGDGVALMCRNRVEWAEVWAACMRAGLYLTPVNWHLTADETAYVVDDCEAVAFVADAAHAAEAAAAAVAAPRLRLRWAVGGPIDGFADYEATVGAEDAAPLPSAEPGAVMMYTSGTTGRPKGVRRARRPLALNPRAGYDDGGVNLCTGPLYHGGPFVVSLVDPLSNGATVVLTDRFDPAETLALIERHRVTHTHMVPTMFHRLLALPEDVRRRHDLSSLRRVVHGAAPCPRWVKEAMIAWWGPVLHEYYSATEGFGCIVDSETWLQRPGTVGRPEPEGQVVVGDDDAVPHPPGTVGTVWLRALPGQRFDYYKDGEKTARTWRGEYFTLGDVGWMDEDGYLYLTDRSVDLVISGGVNVYPSEVDGVLLAHPAVADVATIGVPDEEWGERVLAVVQLRPELSDGPEIRAELMAYAREHLAGYKRPRAVDVVDALPRQENGKVYKRRLREEYRQRAAGL